MAEEIARKFDIVDKIISFEVGHSAAFARNRGAEIARGKYLVFIDANQIVEKNFWLRLKSLVRKSRS